ncbi:MAG TPA: glycosyltransferase 87 family protein [Candidatus Acidoferrales bacterium]|nr:glycosyltransferase 87 family protein [Candidatus Acidoferrales bacterium]
MLAALAILAARDLVKLNAGVSWHRMIDLSVFYCAGSAAAGGADPYASEPVRACEHAFNSGGQWDDPHFAMLVPQPPYDILGFELLPRVGPLAAKRLAAVAITAAVVATALALADLGIPLWAALAALALSDWFVSVFNGQIYAFPLACAALAAACLHRGRDAAAGVFAALCTIEPQLGAAIACGVLLLMPRARLALLATAAAMFFAGAAALGPHAWIEWATRVIPLEARAEAQFWPQYSLTSVAAAVGVPVPVALALGTASSVAILVVALYLAAKLIRRYGRPEFAVLVPAAFAPLGGTFVHLAAIAAAVPLALTLPSLSRQSASRADWRLAAIAVLLAIPWLFAQSMKPLFFSSLLAAVVVVWQLRVAPRPAAGICVATAALLYALALHTPPPLTVAAFASASSSALHLDSTQFDPWREAAKVPTWTGLIALLAAALWMARRPAEAEASS